MIENHDCFGSSSKGIHRLKFGIVYFRASQLEYSGVMFAGSEPGVRELKKLIGWA